VDGCSEAEGGEPVTPPTGWIFFPLRILLGGLFLYSGILKIASPLPFADSIASFQIVPPAVIGLVALGLPPLEIILGAMLVSGWRARVASLGVFVLSVVFCLALSQALVRGLQVDCGCFGSGQPSRLKTWGSLGRDILIIAVSAWLYRVASLGFRHDRGD